MHYIVTLLWTVTPRQPQLGRHRSFFNPTIAMVLDKAIAYVDCKSSIHSRTTFRISGLVITNALFYHDVKAKRHCRALYASCGIHLHTMEMHLREVTVFQLLCAYRLRSTFARYWSDAKSAEVLYNKDSGHYRHGA